MKENKVSKNSAVNKKKDYVTNKLLLVFTVAFALLILLMNVGRMMKSTTTFIVAMTTVKVAAIVAVAAVAIGVIMMIVENSKKTDTTYKLLSGKNVTLGALFVALCTGALAVIFSVEMLMLMYVLVPTVVVLYIVYYSYQREFFMIVLASALGGLGIWVLGSELVNSSDMIALAIAAAAVCVCAVVTVLAQLRGGKLSVFGRDFELFGSDTRYALIYLTFVLVLALLAAAFLIADLTTVFALGLVAYIVVTGIYYTVKLI